VGTKHLAGAGLRWSKRSNARGGARHIHKGTERFFSQRGKKKGERGRTVSRKTWGGLMGRRKGKRPKYNEGKATKGKGVKVNKGHVGAVW